MCKMLVRTSKTSNFKHICDKVRHCHQKPVKGSAWESVVGLEVHAQISSASKLFSGAGTDSRSPVNTNVSLFDAAIPGTLPVLNRRCVEAAVLTALAFSSNISPVSLFDRKHYFYADLPAGYQITQQRAPLARNGAIQFQVFSPGAHRAPYTKLSRLHQLQLEQDSGKSLHDEEMHRSLVDLNRAGVPLMELVFEPDLKDGEEAAALVKELIITLQRLGTCSCRMEEGALRVDANVSVHRKGEKLGTRTEIKNIGSVRGVVNAIQHEIARQIALLDLGGTVLNETRAWDAINKQTVAMRDKEEKQDYRYMPEPNLPPLRLLVGNSSNEQQIPSHQDIIDVNLVKQQLPELPEATRQRLKNDYGLGLEHAIILVNDNILLEHFWSLINQKKSRDPKLIVNFLIMELLTALNKTKLSLETRKISDDILGEIIDLLQNGTVNLLTARKLILEAIHGNPLSPAELTTRNNWAQISSTNEVEQLCQNVIESNPLLVKQYQNGKKKVFGALLGEIAKVSQQRANMALVAKTLKQKLGE